MRSRRLACALAFGVLAALGACTNDPYPSADADKKILYLPFDDPPKTLDPQVAYSVVDHMVIGAVYDTLLEYHYLKRPYTLIPGLAEAVPEPRTRPDGRSVVRFRLRPGLRFQEDPCFPPGPDGKRTRDVLAQDAAFALMRIADPAVNSPVLETFSKISGLRAFGERLAKLREDEAFRAKRIDAQYAEAGPVEGVRVLDDLSFELTLDEPYPQILYWFAMPFTAPVPFEAIATYDGRDDRPAFDEHAVGTGPWRVTVYDKRSRIALERNPEWYGVRHPEWKAPGATYPTEGEPGDAAAGYLGARAGRGLPFLERLEYRRDKESIPAFTKFLQGYYDLSGIVKESFDRVIRGGELSPDMAARGMQLSKSVSPDVYYIGFNMDDPVVGAPGGERARKLRQAMSLAIDSREFARLFLNGRGIPAQTPIPPGIFGYDAAYRNPFRQPDLERAAALLREAGLPGGIDPATGRPVKLTFDTADTSTSGLLTFQFFVNAWSRLGLDVEIAATSYNQFQEKIRKGAFQVFMFGWVADYPDPENFLFLLWSAMGRSRNGGPNSANFADPRYDRLFLEMKARENDPERLRVIDEMRSILETERPWIELFHRESFALAQGWVAPPKPVGLSIPTAKYLDLDPALRARMRSEWNRPVLWPVVVIVVVLAALVAPAVRTYLRERQ